MCFMMGLVGVEVFPLHGLLSVSVDFPVVPQDLAGVTVCVMIASARDKVLVLHTSGCSSVNGITSTLQLCSTNKPLGMLGVGFLEMWNKLLT